ncbi:MAG: Fur family transcriptional regulator [Pseudomonadota bacterium]|nr:Fur family transcriptional regulator [Pseudomonadota bacterium]
MESVLEELCRSKGLKITKPRKLIAKIISESDDHPDVEEIYRRASENDQKISLATVYRTVRILEDAKVIESHHFGDGRARYECTLPSDDHHHHIIDVTNGGVIEFQDEILESVKQKIARDHGYEIVGERLELYCKPIGTKK